MFLCTGITTLCHPWDLHRVLLEIISLYPVVLSMLVTKTVLDEREGPTFNF